uniref:EGF-like domain-containing protein n=1 Tax=Hucho hucho TaxID=62062 RepID=A0A4W5M7V3_9TELE
GITGGEVRESLEESLGNRWRKGQGVTALSTCFLLSSDLDECQGTPRVCTSNAICLNTIGSYHCQCQPGFRLSSSFGHCVDLDECQETPQVCGSNGSCLNTFGSYNCQCQPGFRSSKHTLKVSPTRGHHCVCLLLVD